MIGAPADEEQTHGDGAVRRHHRDLHIGSRMDIRDGRRARRLPDTPRGRRTVLPHLPKDARVLDVGCGGGKFTKYIADQRPDVHILGIDLSKPQIARAAKHLRRYSDRVRFEHGDATQLAFPDGSFDGVISYGFIKHWTSQDAGLAECMTRPQTPRPVVGHRSGSQRDL